MRLRTARTNPTDYQIVMFCQTWLINVFLKDNAHGVLSWPLFVIKTATSHSLVSLSIIPVSLKAQLLNA